MVKWTTKVLWYTKTIIDVVKGLKVVAKCCVSWIFIHDDLYVVLNTQMWNIKLRLQNLSLKAMLKSEWLNLVLDIDFMTLNILKLELYFVFLESIIYLRASSQYSVEKHQFNVILS